MEFILNSIFYPGLAENKSIKNKLGRKPGFANMKGIIETAWKGRKNNPNGF